MVHTYVEARIQNMQKFHAISLTNGRPDLTTENHWIKKFHWAHFFWLNNIYFHTKKTPFEYKNFLNIFFEWQNSYKTKIFFWLNKNMHSFLDKKNIEYKNVFFQHFSNHTRALINNYALTLFTCWKKKITIHFLFFLEITRETSLFLLSFACEQNFLLQTNDW